MLLIEDGHPQLSARPLLWEGVFRHVLDKGALLEFGVFDGTSINEIAKIVSPRSVVGFDWFFGLQEEWANNPKGTFNRNGVPPKVDDNVEIIVGLVQDTLHEFIARRLNDEFVAFVHFDMDLYSPTAFVLQGLRRYFVPGTVLVFDEYDDADCGREHEQKAFAEFIAVSGFRAEFLGRGRHRTAYAFRLAR